MATSWQESYHNGDVYDERVEPLSPEDLTDRLKGVESRLWGEAESKTRRETEIERKAKERAAIRRATEKAVFGLNK